MGRERTASARVPNQGNTRYENSTLSEGEKYPFFIAFWKLTKKMARARNIKPGLFKNEHLGISDPYVSLLFIGLWTLGDKAGRLEDRPLRIRAELFPYRDNFDINGYLTQLQRLGFIHRYKVGDLELIEIANFTKHQNPHHTEKPSEYPAYSSDYKTTVKSPLNNGYAPADSLIPDSLIPDSLSSSSAKQKAIKKPAIDKTELQEACKKTWSAYSTAYCNLYGTNPIRNATVNSHVMNFVKRMAMEEAPSIAAWFVSHKDNFYSKGGHAFGLLLKDAEKLRTEWATGKFMSSNTPSVQDARLFVTQQIMGGLASGNNRSPIDITPGRTIESIGASFPEAPTGLRYAINGEVGGD